MKTYLKDLTTEEIIKRLKNGEVVKIENDKGYYKMRDGIICKYYDDEDIGIGDIIYKKSNDVYFEKEEPFEITGTGLYKTRDGRKAFVSYIDNDIRPVNGIIEGEEEMMYWTRDGFIYDARKYDREDIISKWED